MPQNLAYLAAAVIAVIVLARSARPNALLAAALALVTVLAVLVTIEHGPDALTAVIDALARLLHRDQDG